MKNHDGMATKFSDTTLNLFDRHTGSSFENKVDWNCLLLCDKVYPELSGEIKNLIEKRLGYFPNRAKTIRSEPDLRILYHQYRYGQITVDELYERSDMLIKHIRNNDLRPDYRLYNHPNIYEEYARTYLPYMQMARKRIQFILGYDSPLEYSLAAEIWLSQILAKDNIVLSNNLSSIDYRVMTSINYREILLNYGEREAKSSPLLAMKSIV